MSEYKFKATLNIVGGFLVQATARAEYPAEFLGAWQDFILLALFVVGYIAVIVGCKYYALHKGYSGSWGLGLGILNLLGVFILFLYPDKIPHQPKVRDFV